MGDCGGAQGELFTLPGTVREPKMATPPAKERFTRDRSAGRVLCDDCVRAIHRLGVAVAPYPAAARWRCTSGDRLCEVHKDERLAG